jgi:propionyl-CoA carboxylase alpha chain
VRTTIPVLARAIAHPDFRAGRLSTGFLDRVLPALTAGGDGPNRSIAIVAAVIAEHERARRSAAAAPPADPTLDAWRLAVRRPAAPEARW